ncbi:hypothetical protein AMECASPLE_039333 [Ameca splendens]|uniref:Uncharacterized protein n=1 Tax=Ameca splendens TaxID=208324 RepID=A0ABV0Y957_9TELE
MHLIVVCMNFCISVVLHEGDQSVVLLRCNGSPGCLLGLMSLIFLLTILHIFSKGFRSAHHWPIKHSICRSSVVGCACFCPNSCIRRVCFPIKHNNTMVIEPAFGTFGSVGTYQVLQKTEINITIKLVSRRKHEVLYAIFPAWLR